MIRKPRIARRILGGLAGALVALALMTIQVVRTPWFSGQLRQRMIAELAEATGGRVEIEGLDFDWRTLTASVRNLTIHGTEPGSEAPLFRADSIWVGLRIVSIWRKEIHLASLAVNRPQVNLIVYPDGRTNMPQPRAARRARKNAVETVLDLAIRRFQISDGTVQLAARRLRLNALGENLRVQILYASKPARYRGVVSFRHLNVAPGRGPALPIDVDASLTLAADRLDVSRLHLGLKDSSLEVKGTLENFARPHAELDYSARVYLKDIARNLRLAEIPGRGVATVAGRAAFGGTKDYLVTGKVQGSGLEFEEGAIGVRNIGLKSAVKVTPERIEIEGIELSVLEGRFSGRAEMTAEKRFRVEGQLRDYSLAELTRWETRRPLAWNGTVSGPVSVTGELREGQAGNLVVNTRLTIQRAEGEDPVDGLIDLSYNQSAGSIDFEPSYVATRYSRTEFSGRLGQRVAVSVETGNLSEYMQPIGAFTKGPPPVLPFTLLGNGITRLKGGVSGSIESPTIQGRAVMTHFEYAGYTFDRAEGDVAISGAGVTARNLVVTKDQVRAVGTLDVAFQEWRTSVANLPVTGAFAVRAAAVAPVLAEFGVFVPVTGGSLTGDVKIGGTEEETWATVTTQISKPVAWGQPLDWVRGQLRYTDTLLTASGVQIQAGTSQAEVSGQLEHPEGIYREGRLSLQVASRGFRMERLPAIGERAPGLGGRLETQMTGEFTVAHGELHPRVVNGWIAAKDLTREGDHLGWLSLAASSQARTLATRLEGELAGAKVSGESQWALGGDEVRGRLEWTALSLARMLAHVAPASAKGAVFEGTVAGKVSFSGAPSDPGTWKATAELGDVELHPAASAIEASNPRGLGLRNAGPVIVDLDIRGARIRQARWHGKITDVNVSGSLGFGAKNPWDLHLQGDANLALLEDIDDQISASGAASLDVWLHGSLERPDLSGRVDLKDASVNVAGLPNGIENTNGSIFLNQDRAVIDHLSGSSGGGKVSLTGFVGFGSVASFHLQLKAADVRVRYPEGASSTVNANLSFTGTTGQSLLAGDLVVTRMSFNPRSDLASMLAPSAQPVRAPGPASRFERGVHLDAHIVTSSQVRLETSLSRNIQADADLRLRGDPIRPVLVGRVLISQGNVMFFGNQYSIGSGQILFVNTNRIEPVVNLDLETTARGVEVTLHISGTMEKLNVSYRSDPPLSFTDIVGLLTTGRTPASVQGLGGPQTQYSQEMGQAGPGTLLGQAIASPIAGRLERFFGVSHLKIDPQLTGMTTGNAVARITLEQQISSNLSFTSVTDVTRAQAQVLRVEWDLSGTWAAVAIREENGMFGIDFLYKKQFK
ncbi:MAG: translocation/assembly module TamB domain-containing protein [Bryobacteraceae bacterium]